tara:strand:- start:61105 stop:61929 length:825 start_codon:yes stop_codon:yes gene_type:complete
MQLRNLILIATFLISPFAIGSEYEDCSWKCKKIPPLSESYEFWGSPQSTHLDANSINLLVWNVYKGREDQFEREFTEFMDRADIAVLQEATLSSQMSDTYNKTQGVEFHLAVSFLMKRNVPTGNITTSRAITEIAQPLRTVDREPFSKSPKMNLVTRYSLSNGQKLLVINIHGINFRDTDRLKAQIELAKSYMDAHDGPIVYAGDFNTKNEEKLEMADRWMESYGMERLKFDGDNRRKKLDNVYFRGLEVRDKQLLTNVEGSDHPAITVEFLAP